MDHCKTYLSLSMTSYAYNMTCVQIMYFYSSQLIGVYWRPYELVRMTTSRGYKFKSNATELTFCPLFFFIDQSFTIASTQKKLLITYKELPNNGLSNFILFYGGDSILIMLFSYLLL